MQSLLYGTKTHTDTRTKVGSNTTIITATNVASEVIRDATYRT